MSRFRYFVGVLSTVLIISWGLASPVPKPRPVPIEEQPNSNVILKKHSGQVQITTSSAWSGYPAQHLIDDNLETTWYSENGDCQGKNREPWVILTFSEEVAINRVTILGSRDTMFPTGYGVLEGQLLLQSTEGQTLVRITRSARGEKKDFHFLLAETLPKVRTLKFRILNDETIGSVNSVCAVALSEILVE